MRTSLQVCGRSLLRTSSIHRAYHATRCAAAAAAEAEVMVTDRAEGSGPAGGTTSRGQSSVRPRLKATTAVAAASGHQMTLRESIQRVAEEREARKEEHRRDALDRESSGVPRFRDALAQRGLPPLERGKARSLQINIGKLCNLTCRHCHVESGPTKLRENMSAAGVDRCLALLAAAPNVTTVDITGGAPELHPHFRRLVAGARALGRTVIDRCNLVILFERGQEDLPAFLAQHGVHIVASLPCYTEGNTDKQRGRRVHQDSVDAIRMLNDQGYGVPGSSLRLDLVYNPGGAFLPPPQAQLETDYRSILREEHGITFNALLAITNMPIKRFADDLERQGGLGAYVSTLAGAFNESTVDEVMCRDTINVAWDGRIYDCDFNAALGLQVPGEKSIWNIDNLDALTGAAIRTGKHCYGCTAGSGSSCGGALA